MNEKPSESAEGAQTQYPATVPDVLQVHGSVLCDGECGANGKHDVVSVIVSHLAPDLESIAPSGPHVGRESELLF